MNKPEIKTVLTLLFEGYEPFEVDTASYGADSIIMATDAHEAMGDVLFQEDLEDAPENWSVRKMDISELINHYPAWKTTLAALRLFPGWQDAGQQGSKDWNDEQPMIVFPDGSVQIDEENGYLDLCPAPKTYHGNDWIQWLSDHYGED